MVTEMVSATVRMISVIAVLTVIFFFIGSPLFRRPVNSLWG